MEDDRLDLGGTSGLLVTAQSAGVIHPAGLEITVATDRDLDVLVVELVHDSTPSSLYDLFAPSALAERHGRGVRFRDVAAGVPCVVYARGLPDSPRSDAKTARAILSCIGTLHSGSLWTALADTGPIELQLG